MGSGSLFEFKRREVIVKFHIPGWPCGNKPETTMSSELMNSVGAQMERISPDSLVDIIFHLNWKSSVAAHTEGYQASRVNIWRDCLPEALLKAMTGKQAGDTIELKFEAGDIIPVFDEKKSFTIKNRQYDRRFSEKNLSRPRIGRFYPKGLLRDIAGIYRANVQPFRCVGLDNGQITVDFNHPMCGKELLLNAMVGKVDAKEIERGGSSVDLMEVLTTGPGMQSPWQENHTDFFSENAFTRDDLRPDTEFYSKPRFVQHLDDTALEVVRSTYGRFLTDNMEVLDLMSSWQSHLPSNLTYKAVTGIGLNQEELIRNSQLSNYRLQDLNINTALRFKSNSFDIVICTASIEYLIHPHAIFDEVSRVLRPNGYFIITFSNRWFSNKAIKIWKELHEFERMGLVLEYFRCSENYKNLQTYSIRGLPRPRTDKYFPDLAFSDPIYAVWGQNR